MTLMVDASHRQINFNQNGAESFGFRVDFAVDCCILRIIKFINRQQCEMKDCPCIQEMECKREVLNTILPLM